MKNHCLTLILLASFWQVALHGHGDENASPNILILLGDDIDRDTLGPWGGEANTPNLDQLARDGMRFDNFYANVAMCAPFRQELYSGRSAWRTRAIPNHSRSVKETKSLPHYLRPLGYRVGLIGKSHVGPQQAYPFDRVGDLPKEDSNPVAIELAQKYIRSAKENEQPFCLVVAAHDAHGPYTNGDPSQYDHESFTLQQDAIDTPEYRRNMAKHFAEITNLDALLGELRSLLEEEKLSDNTLIVFCSEQGNGFPFSKWTCFDDGLASGIVAALPDVIPAGRNCTAMGWIADIAPTLIEAAGGIVDEESFDGKSQWANFKGGDEEVHQYAYGIFSNCNILDNKDRVFPVRSIRDNRFTLIWSPRHDEEITSNVTLTQALELVNNKEVPDSPNLATSWVLKALDTKATADDKLVYRFHHRPEWALYDRSSDPEELENLVDSPEYSEQFVKLQAKLKLWLNKWDDQDPVATEQSFLNKN